MNVLILHLNTNNFRVNVMETNSNNFEIPPKADNFYKSDSVIIEKVCFLNKYKMKICGNLFRHKDIDTSVKHPALIVGHPMGAVKEQSANLYAAKMAELGFVTLSFDLSFWGESEGETRYAVLPDV